MFAILRGNCVSVCVFFSFIYSVIIFSLKLLLYKWYSLLLRHNSLIQRCGLFSLHNSQNVTKFLNITYEEEKKYDIFAFLKLIPIQTMS